MWLQQDEMTEERKTKMKVTINTEMHIELPALPNVVVGYVGKSIDDAHDFISAPIETLSEESLEDFIYEWGQALRAHWAARGGK